MNKYNYMKKQEDLERLSTEELIRRTLNANPILPKHARKILLLLIIIIPIFSLFIGIRMLSGNKDVVEENNITLVSMPLASTSAKKDLISIPTGTVKANPFVPYRDIGGTSSVTDVPQYELVAPPEVVEEGSDGARVMDTIVSGILYDKYSPSAILNIEGNDYLVKKGDVVNNYKVLNITQDSVSVKLGNNTYKAGIGEILTEGEINYNNVSNLGKKFGGERR